MLSRLLDQNVFKQYLESDEKVQYVAHKHLALLFKDVVLLLVVGGAIPLGVYYSNPDLQWVALAIATYGLLKFSYAFLLWFYDCWVITNKGVIDIEWDSLWNRRNIRFAFDNFEGITTETNGILKTILRMGDVMLIRIVDTNQIRLVNCYNPNKVESKVLKAKADYHHKVHDKKVEKETFLTGIIADMVSDYAERNNIDLR